ncbi:hypothetical protein JI426_004908 [Escherichia coli O22:H8]|nr:hypothetical protein AMK81_23090 [Escherichia coli]UQY79150.1 hypothetical protein JI426_004908 [Escherichia coli O22:H8]OWC25298.1 hypothetical protein A8G19_18475 [Escherichia coli]OWC29083.1 hypothetical protein A8G09_22025 [Escherichia coli]GCJ66249.1 hypothetical protein BvCmsG15A_00980 [Escherichia coli]
MALIIIQIPAPMPGSFYQILPTMPVPALNHRHIAGVIERAGEGVKPLEHLWPVDVSHAQPLGAAPQLAAVLGGDDDAVGHHPDFNRHPVSKSRLFQCCHAKAAHGQVPEAQGAVPSPAGDAAGIMQGKLLFNSGKKRVGLRCGGGEMRQGQVIVIC